MARSNAVWGIDIGNCSLKAMRGYTDDANPGAVIVDAVDYIEYSQILTQPGVDADAEVREALKLFLSRNSIKGDKIAFAMSGQNGLVRFLKLPPIEPKKIPEIVKYEAKQQIAFLNEVIWKWQRMGQQAQETAFPLEVEIGLFAVKRDQIFKMVTMSDSLGIPIDTIQLTPLVLYNYLMHDEMGELPSMDDYDPENPPPYVVVLSMGTDSTDLILTNGFRAWQRNLPIGGNHFTKALMKELKLTFAKADHLKRNLAASQDKVAVLRAMQPVFNQFQNEIQRSLGFFSSLDPNAQYERVIGLGNAMKLTGLTRYLSQNLGIDVATDKLFPNLDTSNLADSSLIKENLSTFGTCYGLCLQGLKKGTLNTNFLPGDVVLTRLINSKKPWMLAATALLMLGSAIGFAAQMKVQPSVADKNWQVAESKAEGLATKAKSFQEAITTQEQTFQTLDKMGEDFIMGFRSRTAWLELLTGINACLPVESAPLPDESKLTAEECANAIMSRKELHIVNIEAQPLSDYESQEWMRVAITSTNGEILPDKLKKTYKKIAAAAAKAAAAGDDEEADSGDDGEESPMDALIRAALAPEKIAALAPAAEDGEEGEGEEEAAPAETASEESGGEDEDEEGVPKPKKPARWIVSIYGYHWHNGNQERIKLDKFVEDSFLSKMTGPDALQFKLPLLKSAALIDPDAQGAEVVTMSDLGVRYPVIINKAIEASFNGGWKDNRTREIRDEYMLDPMAMNARTRVPAMGMDPTNPEGIQEVPRRMGRRYDFVIHFLWEPKSAVDRAELRVAVQAAEAKRAAEEKEAQEMLDGEDSEDSDDSEE
ncbi:MAG: pilus assembly protein PilM [Thermoguttaceae bacterium]|nr:pilus assembly protein PilM [Thermoguttaceae bacterium]